jgi:phage gp36-like protein
MAVKAYCVKADVDDIWSEEGIESRFDDDADASLSEAELARVDRFIKRASIIVGSRLKSRFADLASFEGSNAPTNTPESVRYMTAVVAAYLMASRRGLPVQQEVKDQYEEVLQWLTTIQTGGGLPIDLSEDLNRAPFVSNFTIDGSYRTRKVRVTEANSTGGESREGIKRAREQFAGYPWE